MFLGKSICLICIFLFIMAIGISFAASIKKVPKDLRVSIYNTNVGQIEKIFAKINAILRRKDKSWDEYPRLRD